MYCSTAFASSSCVSAGFSFLVSGWSLVSLGSSEMEGVRRRCVLTRRGAGAPLGLVGGCCCGGLAGVAACAWCPIGLDAEHGSPHAMDTAVRARALHPDEIAAEHLMAGQAEPFFGLWARKEAALKALGTGLGLDPRLVAVGWPAASWQRVTSPAGEHLEVRSVSAPNTTPAAVAVCFGHLASVSDRVRREVPQYDPTLRRLSVGVRNTQSVGVQNTQRHKALAGVAQGHHQNPACPPRLSQHLVPCHAAAV